MSYLPQASIAEEHFLLGNPLEDMVAKVANATTNAVTAVADAVNPETNPETNDETDDEKETEPEAGDDQSPVDDNAKEIKTKNDVFKAPEDGKENFFQSVRREGFVAAAFKTPKRLLSQAGAALDISIPYSVATISVVFLSVFCVFMLINAIIRSLAASGPFQTFGRYISYPSTPWEQPGSNAQLAPLEAADFVSGALTPAARQARIDKIKNSLYGDSGSMINPLNWFRWGRSIAAVGNPITNASFNGPEGAGFEFAGTTQGEMFAGDVPAGFNKAASLTGLFQEAHKQLMREGQDLFTGHTMRTRAEEGVGFNYGYSSVADIEMKSFAGQTKAGFMIGAIVTVLGYFWFSNKLISTLEEQNRAAGGRLKLPKGKQIWKFWAWGVSAVCLIVALTTLKQLNYWNAVRKNDPSLTPARPARPAAAPTSSGDTSTGKSYWRQAFNDITNTSLFAPGTATSGGARPARAASSSRQGGGYGARGDRLEILGGAGGASDIERAVAGAEVRETQTSPMAGARRAAPAAPAAPAPLLRAPTGIRVDGEDLDLTPRGGRTSESVFGKKVTRRTRGAAKTIQKAVRKTRSKK